MSIDKETNKKTSILLSLIVIILIVALIAIFLNSKVKNSNNTQLSENNNQETGKLSNELTQNISAVPTMEDKISSNGIWCGTFQLVWNDMQNNLVDGNVEFDEPNEMVDNLNAQKFTENSISEEYYYKKWGVMSNSLKEEIEQGIKDKFNETSDILDSFNWPSESEVSQNNYFFYSMLRRDFEFENEFTILKNNKFGNVKNVEYFGIDSQTDSVVRNQVKVLYYNDENNFAVILCTKQGDQVMLVRNPEGNTFSEIYDNANKQYEEYKGNKSFAESDTLSVPNLDIDVLKEYEELEKKAFKLKDGSEAYIDQAIQTIKMKLNNKGGSIKSEAAIVVKSSFLEVENEEPRNFNFNDKFTIFLLEESNTPYFAANIENIELFK